MAQRRLVMQPLAAGRQAARALATATETGTVTAGMLHQGVDHGGRQSCSKECNVPTRDGGARLANLQDICNERLWLLLKGVVDNARQQRHL